MSNIIKKLPLPISGLMLALAGLGNLLVNYGEVYRNFFGVISGLIFLGLLVKIVTTPKKIIEDLENHVVLSVFPTFTMGMMLLSTYIKPFAPFMAYGFWFLSLLLHALLIIIFTKRHILNFDIKKVLPSYFIVYVGIVVGSVTAPVHNSIYLGQIIFWFGLISYLILLPIVLYRVIVIKNIPEPALPTITIFAAPASLCLAGYISTFPEKSMAMIGFLSVLSSIMLVAVIIYLPKMLKIKFYPSYSGFTFPLVISAIAIKLTNGFLMKSDFSFPALNYVVKFEEILSASIVLYVLFRYVAFLSLKEKVVENQKLKTQLPENLK